MEYDLASSTILGMRLNQHDGYDTILSQYIGVKQHGGRYKMVFPQIPKRKIGFNSKLMD